MILTALWLPTQYNNHHLKKIEPGGPDSNVTCPALT